MWSSYLILTTIRYQLSSTVAPVIIMATKTSQISGCVCVREKSRLKFKNILTQRDFSFISLSAGLRCLKTNKRRMLFHCCCVVSLFDFYFRFVSNTIHDLDNERMLLQLPVTMFPVVTSPRSGDHVTTDHCLMSQIVIMIADHELV